MCGSDCDASSACSAVKDEASIELDEVARFLLRLTARSNLSWDHGTPVVYFLAECEKLVARDAENRIKEIHLVDKNRFLLVPVTVESDIRLATTAIAKGAPVGLV